MARREVDPDPEYGKRNYLKMKDVFQNVGDAFVGLYVEDSEGTYGPQFTFQQRDGNKVTVTISNKQLVGQLKKCKLQPGEKVSITFVGTKKIENVDSPMRLFKVIVDDGPKGALKVTPKPPPKPAADEWAGSDEDVPF